MIFNSADPNRLFKLVTVIHWLSFAVQSALLLILYILSLSKVSYLITDPLIITYMQYAAIIAGLAIMPLNEYFVKRKVAMINQDEDKEKRIETYFSFLIIKLAVSEMGSILASVLFYITGHKTFLYLAVILIIYFLINKPGKIKISSELNIEF